MFDYFPFEILTHRIVELYHLTINKFFLAFHILNFSISILFFFFNHFRRYGLMMYYYLSIIWGSHVEIHTKMRFHFRFFPSCCVKSWSSLIRQSNKKFKTKLSTFSHQAIDSLISYTVHQTIDRRHISDNYSLCLLGFIALLPHYLTPYNK